METPPLTAASGRTNKIPPSRPERAAAFPIDFAAAPPNSPTAHCLAIASDLQSHRGTVFQFSRRALAFAAALILLPWIIVAAWLFHLRPGPPAASDPGAPYDNYVHQCRPGPWGELQYSRLLIEPPDEFAPDDYTEPDQVRWVFKGYTPAALDTLWQSAGLSPTQIQALHAPAALAVAPDQLVVTPPADLVLALSPEARTKIYSVLSAFAENPNQQEPFRFRADSADEWFQDSGVSPATLALIRRLLYRRGNSLLFSDHDLVLPRVASRAERVRLIKTLARKSTLLVKLRVRPDSDLDTLTAYWGRGPRRKGLHALLQSISRRPGGITIDLVHLLPRFARAHLFTYPQPSDHPEDNAHDCHWTSLNFFNDPPDERFANADAVKHALETDYTPVVGRPQLGDVFVFTRPDGRVIHSCVYLADDIVFTKNGASEVMPFILMNLPDVIAFYPSDPPLVIHAYRRKDL